MDPKMITIHSTQLHCNNHHRNLPQAQSIGSHDGTEMEHKLLLTGKNLVRSSTATPNNNHNKKETADCQLFSTQQSQGQGRVVDTNSAEFQSSSDLSITAAVDNSPETTHDILSIDSVGHINITQLDVHLPRPNIMPRPIGYNRSSFTSSVETKSSMLGHPSPQFTRNASFSAFTTIGVPRKNISPVPSMNISDCSDSPFNASTTTYADNCIEIQQGDHYYNNIHHSTILSSPNIMHSSIEQYYFTPLQHHNHSNGRSEFGQGNHPVDYSTSHRSFPQCNIMSSNDSLRQMQYEYPLSLQQSNAPVGLFNTMHSRRGPVSYNSAPYCKPANDFCTHQESVLSMRVNTTENNGIACDSLQSPIHDRMKSIDFLESSEDDNGSSSPLPQNLKGDPHRQAKVKTELCLHFACGRECPFGSRCNYAHGEDELKYTKLCELKEAGLVEDITTYRTHPCASWVSTGACPFGLRCSSIHDPRIASDITSWLPHSDIPVSNLETDLMVDKSYHHNIMALNQQNPLVQNLLWDCRPSRKNKSTSEIDIDANDHELNDPDEIVWKDTYSLVCNMSNLSPIPKRSTKGGSSNRPMKINELERVSIALYMSYGNSRPLHSDFVYKPKHMVYGELCMLLQTKYFLLLRPNKVEFDEDNPVDSLIREISLEEYRGRTSVWNKKYIYCPNNVVVVNELAFGCLGETSSKVSLWFDLPEPVTLTNQDIKRHKRNRQRKLAETNNARRENLKLSPYPGSRYLGEVKESLQLSFENHFHKPFFHMQPIGNSTVGIHLIQLMLKHRLSVLVRRKYIGDSIQVKESIALEEMKLQGLFLNMQKDVSRWKWPVTKGRENVSSETSVPHCSINYEPSEATPVSNLWESLLNCTPYQQTDNDEPKSRRLPIFETLARGQSIQGNTKEVLHHIKSQVRNVHLLPNEAWETILGENSTGGWNIIKDHYLDEKAKKNKNKNMPLSPSNIDK